MIGRAVRDLLRSELWLLALPGRVLILGVAVAAAALVAASVASAPSNSPEVMARAAFILVCGVAEYELLFRRERKRLSVANERRNGSWHNWRGMWMFAAGVTLPFDLALMVAALLSIYTLVRMLLRTRVYRQVYTAGTYVLGTAAAWMTIHAISGAAAGLAEVWVAVAALIGAQVAFVLTQSGLVALAMHLAAGVPLRETTNRRELGFEALIMSFGAIIGVLVASPFPWAVVFFAAPLAVITRLVGAVEETQLPEADPANAFLGDGAWYVNAERAIERATGRGQELVILLVVVDQLSAVIRERGRVAGDALVNQLGQHLRDRAPHHEMIGRQLHTDCIAVLVTAPGSTTERAAAVRASVSSFSFAPPDATGRRGELTASIGVARLPDDGISLPELLAAADRNLAPAPPRPTAATTDRPDRVARAGVVRDADGRAAW